MQLKFINDWYERANFSSPQAITKGIAGLDGLKASLDAQGVNADAIAIKQQLMQAITNKRALLEAKKVLHSQSY